MHYRLLNGRDAVGGADRGVRDDSNFPDIAEIRLEIEKTSGCPATHVESVISVEGWREQIVWEGNVEVFELTGHRKAKRAYGWRDYSSGEFTAVLGIPPVDSPETAIKVAIAAKARSQR